MEIHPRNRRAAELYGDFWFNSEPISIRAFQGYIILLDFFSFSNSSSLRSLPYVREWTRRYQPMGMVTIGVHTPEFKFGRDATTVEKALKRLDIHYPVVSDNEALIWSAYGIRTWPTKLLIDRDGFVRYSLPGEGGYEQLERAIQALLIEAGLRGDFPELMEPIREADRPGVVCLKQTADVHLGYLRGTIGNVEGFSPESTIVYHDQGLYMQGRFYVHGAWFNEREFFRFSGEGEERGSLTILYEGLEANLVARTEGEGSCDVQVEQDGLPLSKEICGEDVQVLEAGSSVLRVGIPRLYNVVRNKEFGLHSLKLTTGCPRIAFYSFSFTTDAIPELVFRN